MSPTTFADVGSNVLTVMILKTPATIANSPNPMRAVSSPFSTGERLSFQMIRAGSTAKTASLTMPMPFRGGYRVSPSYRESAVPGGPTDECICHCPDIFGGKTLRSDVGGPDAPDRPTLDKLGNVASHEHGRLEDDGGPEHRFPCPLLRDLQEQTCNRDTGKGGRPKRHDKDDEGRYSNNLGFVGRKAGGWLPEAVAHCSGGKRNR